eukprot:SAG22_NODE_6049_length_909_cov_2.770833_2_plen_55_part_01
MRDAMDCADPAKVYLHEFLASAASMVRSVNERKSRPTSCPSCILLHPPLKMFSSF